MIYEVVQPNDPIRQGDIFKGIPHIHYDPSKLLVVKDGNVTSISEQNWIERIANSDVRVIVRVQSTYAIVASQDCDTQRDDFIAFFKIEKILDITGWTVPEKKSPENQLKWWMERLTKNAHAEDKWFYLPPDKDLGLEERMVADFQTIIPVPLQFLQDNKSKLRVGRLNIETDEHFREKIAHYFRRYPYDEWYPLSKDEFEVYTENPTRKDSEPRNWQK